MQLVMLNLKQSRICVACNQKSSSFDQVGRGFLMQDRHERGRTESVMLGPAFQTSWVMEKLHDKSLILPDPDIFTFDIAVRTTKFGVACSARSWTEVGRFGILILPRRHLLRKSDIFGLTSDCERRSDIILWKFFVVLFLLSTYLKIHKNPGRPGPRRGAAGSYFSLANHQFFRIGAHLFFDIKITSGSSRFRV